MEFIPYPFFIGILCLSCIVFKVTICDALRDLVSFAQFENREKHPC